MASTKWPRGTLTGRTQGNTGNFFFKKDAAKNTISLYAFGPEIEVTGEVTKDKPLSVYLREFADKIDGMEVEVFQVGLKSYTKLDAPKPEK